MRKFLVGCGVVFLMIMILVVGLGVFMGLKVKNFSTQMESNAKAVQKLETDYPFTAPAKGPLALDEMRFESYLRVRRSILDVLLQNDLVKKILEAKDKGKGAKPDVGFFDVMSIFGSLNPLFETAQQQLGREKMSPSEYYWILETTIATLREGARRGDPEMKKVTDELRTRLSEIDVELQSNPNFKSVQLDDGTSLADVKVEDEAPEPPDPADAAPTPDEATAPVPPPPPGAGPRGKRIPQENIELVRRHLDELTKDVDMLAVELTIATIIKESSAEAQRQRAVQMRRRGARVRFGPHGGGVDATTEDASSKTDEQENSESRETPGS